MIESNLSRRDILRFGVAASIGVFIGTGCDSREENTVHSPTKESETKIIQHQPVQVTPENVALLIEEKSKEKWYFSPINIAIPRLEINYPIEEGTRTADGKSLFVPEGGHIVDYSRVFPAGNKTMVLAGHSYWQNIMQPMGRTFEFEKDDQLNIDDVNLGPVKFTVDRKLISNWSGVVDLIQPNRTEGKVVMFTTLRTDARENFSQQLPQDIAKMRADNGSDVDENGNNIVDQLYAGSDYLYWVVTSNQTT